MSCLNVEVSEFDSIKNTRTPNKVNLLEWLSDKSRKKMVDAVRNEKASKESLPCITPSGFFNYRAEKGLVEHSRLIAFDIDAKDNHRPMDEIKREIKQIQNVAYLSLSVSGKGLWGLIPIKYPEYHKLHFKAIEQSFNLIGIKIDKAPKNVSSARFYSYDSKPYFNHNAEVFPFVVWDETPKTTTAISSTIEKVEYCIQQVIDNEIDITEGYDVWLKIGFSLCSEFGTSGRDYFHKLSQFYPYYNFDEADDQYTKCLNSTGEGITISTLFAYFKDYGIHFK